MISRRQVMLDLHRLTKRPGVLELCEIHARAIQGLRQQLRREKNRDLRKKIEDALVELKKEWRTAQDLARGQIKKKMRLAQSYFSEEVH